MIHGQSQVSQSLLFIDSPKQVRDSQRKLESCAKLHGSHEKTLAWALSCHPCTKHDTFFCPSSDPIESFANRPVVGPDLYFLEGP